MTNSLEVNDPELVLATSGGVSTGLSVSLERRWDMTQHACIPSARVLDDMADGDIPNGHEHLVRYSEATQLRRVG